MTDETIARTSNSNRSSNDPSAGSAERVRTERTGAAGDTEAAGPQVGAGAVRTSKSCNDLTDEDAANIGRALMERIHTSRPGYSWSDCPTEIVTDLLNEIHDEDRAHTATIESRDRAEQPTPAAVLQWAVDSFGPIAFNRDERAARLAEEAMEVAQAEGVPLLTLQKIAERIYSRPVGELGQEVGGLGITLYALAANCQIDLFAEINREWKRVLSKPRDWWTRKHAEKVAAGTADLSPRPELKANEDQWQCVSCSNMNPPQIDRCRRCQELR